MQTRRPEKARDGQQRPRGASPSVLESNSVTHETLRRCDQNIAKFRAFARREKLRACTAEMALQEHVDDTQNEPGRGGGEGSRGFTTATPKDPSAWYRYGCDVRGLQNESNCVPS